MVTQSTHKRLFPGKPYPGPTEFDNGPEPPVLQLAVEGVKASLERMALSLLKPYQSELDALLVLDVAPLGTSIPWEGQPVGWSVLGSSGSIVYPPCLVGVFDGETLVRQREMPVMAVYLGSNGVYYCWKTPEVGQYIPLRPNSLIVGHNVSYDLALLAEPARGLDTQVFATQVSGFCTDQQWVSYGEGPSDAHKPLWAYKGFGKGNYKSLADTAKFYLGVILDKTDRNLFVEAPDLEALIPDWPTLLNYCAKDVHITHRVFKVLFHLWKGKAPSPISLWGAIVANSYRVPIDPDWDQWLANTEEVYHRTQREIGETLLSIAEEWLKETSVYGPRDAWESQVDWTVKPKTRKLKGYPEWFRKAEGDFSLKSVIGHTLLKVEYLGEPVKWTRKLGYHTDSGRVPHPEGTDGNVGYLFSQDFWPLYETGVLKSRDPKCQSLLDKAYAIAYWTSVRSRALNVRVNNGWTVPMTGGGTVTGRVTEPLWLTTCDPKPKRIGSELKSRIKAPEGHKLVIADFAAQEMRIAWLYADSRVGRTGGTPMSRAGISGDKSKGTDCHSLLATHLTNEAGTKVSRDTSKTVGFAMQYGAGVRKIANTIKLVAPYLSEGQCMRIAQAAIDFRKGKARYFDNERLFYGGTDSESFNAISAIANADRPRTPLLNREMPDPIMPRYVGRDFVTTRNNFTIQATARDQLDILCTAYEYMAQHFGVSARIVWSRHDEVIVVARDAEVDACVELLQQAHAFTWAALHEALGLYDMPSVGLFFEDINIDTVCRKTVDKCTVTPSNPIAEPDGYVVYPSGLRGVPSWAHK